MSELSKRVEELERAVSDLTHAVQMLKIEAGVGVVNKILAWLRRTFFV